MARKRLTKQNAINEALYVVAARAINVHPTIMGIRLFFNSLKYLPDDNDTGSKWTWDRMTEAEKQAYTKQYWKDNPLKIKK